MSRSDATSRFSSRVEHYVRARPGYPDAVYDALQRACGLQPDDPVADLGSGTGLLARLFLVRGHPVTGVEPNAEMRAAAEQLLAEYSRFRSVDGTAEATGLPDASVRLVAAGQAFHWFDPVPARREMRRILRPGGWAALVWNDRDDAGSPFMAEYERLLQRHSRDYAEVDHRRVTVEILADFFGAPPAHVSFPNPQRLDRDGVIARLRSTSYTPEPGEPGYDAMLTNFSALFDRHAVVGKVELRYRTELYYGQLAPERP